MAFFFDPPPPISIPFANRVERMPVRRIYCVGRNFAAHAREMGFDPDREPPFFFMKPVDALVEAGAQVAYPPATEDLHHEIELVVAIGRGGGGIAVEAAEDHVIGYGVGLDLTRRDLQLRAREAGRPWDAGKAFDQSAPLAALCHVADVGHPSSGRIWVEVDGALRQDSDISKLIWSVPEIIAHASALWRLEPGDLIFTGTPEGVGPIARDQRVRGGIDGLGTLEITVV